LIPANIINETLYSILFRYTIQLWCSATWMHLSIEVAETFIPLAHIHATRNKPITGKVDRGWTVERLSATGRHQTVLKIQQVLSAILYEDCK